MPTSEMTRSELIRTMVTTGDLLTGPKSFDERMQGLCEAAAHALQADQLAVMILDEDDSYHGRFHYGLPGRMGETFDQYRARRSQPLVREIERCTSYLAFNKEDAADRLGGALQAAGVASSIIVPFTYPDGDPLGYVTVSYVASKPAMTETEGELAMGMARLVQTTVLRDLETQKRREVSQAMLQVADSERRRLSRDIHDDPLQQILALRIGLEGFRERLGDAELQTELDRYIAQCRKASASLREVMLRTHPSASEMADLKDVLENLVNSDELGQRIELDFRDERSHQSPSYLVPALNRIAEQAARNTLRHANATRLIVVLSDENNGTLLLICDNGDGFEPSSVAHTRLGLVSMRERTELLGGEFDIASAPGEGTDITAWFPHTHMPEANDE